MNVKKVLQGIRDAIVPEESYEVPFENHDIGDARIFKLHYVNHYKRGDFGGYGLVDWPLKPFAIPDGMSKEDAFKVLSYLTDFIEQKMGAQECSFQSVKLLDEVISLERFGFRRIDEKLEHPTAYSLYTVAGRQLLFKRSRYYDTYFEWYHEGVTREEVNAIYQSIGMDFEDPVIIGDEKMVKRLTDK